MSACSAQAMSQVGCRLMVASSANTSLPLAPAVWGDIARALATKAAMSSEADGVASGNEPALPDAAFWPADTSVADFGLVGSPDMSARKLPQRLCGARPTSGQCAKDGLIRPTAGATQGFGRRTTPVVSLGSVLNRRVERNRPRIGQRRRRLDRLERAVVIEEFVEHALDRFLCRVRTGIAHVVVLEAGTDHRNPGLLADVVVRNDARVSFEDGILRTERQDLELAVGH